MKTLILYRPVSEHARAIDEFVREFGRRYPQVRIELLSLDGREGSATASIYDITRYPAIMAMRDDGSPNMTWQGDELPLIDEVASYARN